MNGEWKQKSDGRYHAVLLIWSLALMVCLFAVLERQREQQSVEPPLRFMHLGNGEIVAVEFLTSSVNGGHWDSVREYPGIQQIDLAHVNSMVGGLTPLTEFSKLQHLTLSGNSSINDRDVIMVARACPLAYLSLSHCHGITDRCIDSLIGCRSLRWLNLYDTRFTFDGILRLRNSRRDLNLQFFLSGIEAATYEGVTYDSVTYDTPLGTMTRTLSEYGIGLHRFRLETADEALAALRVATLPQNFLTGEWQPRGMSAIELSGEKVGEFLPQFADAKPEIVWLSISDTRVRRKVGNWSPALVRLTLSQLKSDSDLSGFAKCTSIRTLELASQEPRTEMEHELLAALTDLTTLKCSWSEITPAEARLFARLRLLETLDVPSISDEAMLALLDQPRLPRLTMLRVDEQEFRPETRKRLQQVYPNAAASLW